MDDRKQSITVFVNNLLKKNKMRFRKSAFVQYKLGYLHITDNYSFNEIPEEALIQLIKASIFDFRIRWFIPDILSLTAPNSISDRLLNICIKYPGRFKKTLLMQLSHIWSSPQQLELLNRNIDTEEAFYKLFFYYSTDDTYTLQEFRDFLKRNLRFREQFDDCFYMVIQRGYVISPRKVDILNNFISS